MTAAAAPVQIRELADPQLLASVEDLDLVARWVVKGFLHGLHRSPYVGFSVDFASHREYIPAASLESLPRQTGRQFEQTAEGQQTAESHSK